MSDFGRIVLTKLEHLAAEDLALLVLAVARRNISRVEAVDVHRLPLAAGTDFQNVLFLNHVMKEARFRVGR